MEWLVDAFNGGELTALQDAEEVLGGLMEQQVGAHTHTTGVWHTAGRVQ